MTRSLSLYISLVLVFNINAQTKNALHFDGSNDYVQTKYAGVSGKANRTFEAWIYITSTPSGNNCILDYGSNFTGSRNTFFVNGNRAIGFISGGTNANITSNNNLVSLNKWVHVAFVLNSGTGYLYVDGKQEGTGNLSTVNTPASGTELRIGQRVPGGSIPFNGIIDEVRIWDDALTIGRLDSLNDMEICPDAANLVAYYRFNEGKAASSNSGKTTLPDKVKSSQNGTLNNFALAGSSSNWVKGVNITTAPDTLIKIDTARCGSFSSPGGNFTVLSGIVSDVYTNALGCDSTIEYNVTIKKNSFIYDQQEACDSFRTAKGVLKTESDIYNEIFVNAEGCDSTIQTLLTINKSETISQDIESCYDFTSPSGKLWTKSGLYYDSLKSIHGCDSILAINLTIRQASSSSVYDTVCNKYTGPLGNVYTKSGVYTETIRNQYLCDSVVTLNLVIYQSSDSLLKVQGCDSFTTQSGNNTWFSSGIYTEDFKNINGCDSTVEYDLVIHKATAGRTLMSACDYFVTHQNDSIYTSGEYVYTITNSVGCDSVLTIDLSIIDNEPKLSIENSVLRTQNGFEAYEWLNCDEGMSLVPNASNFSYRPKVSGNYAVVVYEQGCPDTSDCFNYPRTASEEVLAQTNGLIYPNPVMGVLNLSSLDISSKQIHIANRLGMIVLSSETSERINTPYKIDLSNLPSGAYSLKIFDNEESSLYRFIKL